jgi:hypothetical protein
MALFENDFSACCGECHYQRGKKCIPVCAAASSIFHSQRIQVFCFLFLDKRREADRVRFAIGVIISAGVVSPLGATKDARDTRTTITGGAVIMSPSDKDIEDAFFRSRHWRVEPAWRPCARILPYCLLASFEK